MKLKTDLILFQFNIRYNIKHKKPSRVREVIFWRVNKLQGKKYGLKFS